MQTQILSFGDPAAIALARQLLADSQIIAAPTDTVYGLFARFDQPRALEKLYEAKDRPPQKAIPVLIGALDQLAQLTPLPLPPLAHYLAECFWPGALTLVLPALPTLPAILTAEQPTVGIRMPAHAPLCALLQQTGPLAATSANLSGQPEAHDADGVLAQLYGRLPLILAEPSQPAQVEQPPSTVVVLTDEGAGIRILRKGVLAPAIEAAAAEFAAKR
jgi:L-threonylcarbamoyladenylate synthase